MLYNFFEGIMEKWKERHYKNKKYVHADYLFLDIVVSDDMFQMIDFSGKEQYGAIGLTIGGPKEFTINLCRVLGQEGIEQGSFVIEGVYLWEERISLFNKNKLWRWCME